jgi:hypothetical protein
VLNYPPGCYWNTVFRHGITLSRRLVVCGAADCCWRSSAWSGLILIGGLENTVNECRHCVVFRKSRVPFSAAGLWNKPPPPHPYTHRPFPIRSSWILDVKRHFFHFSVFCTERKLTGSCVFRTVPFFFSTLRRMQSGQMFTGIRKGDGWTRYTGSRAVDRFLPSC